MPDVNLTPSEIHDMFRLAVIAVCPKGADTTGETYRRWLHLGSTSAWDRVDEHIERKNVSVTGTTVAATLFRIDFTITIDDSLHGQEQRIRGEICAVIEKLKPLLATEAKLSVRFDPSSSSPIRRDSREEVHLYVGVAVFDE